MSVCRMQKCVRFFCAHGHPEEDFQPELTGAKQGKMALPCLILLDCHLLLLEAELKLLHENVS